MLLRRMICVMLYASPMIECPDSTEHCLFIFPECEQLDEDWSGIVSFARQMSTLCEFIDDKKSVRRVKQQLNRCIREGIVIDDLTQEAIAFDNDMDVNVLFVVSCQVNQG